MLRKVYLRYIDDVYTVFADTNSCSCFLSSLNSLQNDIKFTLEKANKTLHFLDVEIELNDVGLHTCLSKTYKELLLYFYAICPTTWKSGLIKCFLD